MFRYTSFSLLLLNLITPLTLLIPLLVIYLINGIELNPGFKKGFLSFCNWNLNSLSKDPKDPPSITHSLKNMTREQNRMYKEADRTNVETFRQTCFDTINTI